jgi:hypothetical protein
METSTAVVMCKSSAIWNAAGATMEDTSADIMVKSDMVIATIHFFRSGQL